MSNCSKQDGFTLIEVLIAAAIITATIGVILQLFSSATMRTHKAASHAHLILAQKQIYQRLSALNLTTVSQGNGEIENLKYQWKAQAKTQQYPIHSNDFLIKKISRYLITVTLQLRNGKKQQLHWEQLAWE